MCRKTGFINRAFTILRALDTRVTFADYTHASKGWVSSDPFEKMFHFEANGPNCSVFDDKCRRLYLIFFYLQVIGTFKDIGGHWRLSPHKVRSHLEYLVGGIILHVSQAYDILFILCIVCLHIGKWDSWRWREKNLGCMRECLSINNHLVTRRSARR